MDIDSEVIAELAKEVIKDPQKFLEDINYNPSIVQKIADLFKNIAQNFKNFFTKAEKDQISKAYDALVKAIRENPTQERTTAKAGVQYDIEYDVNNTPYVVLKNDILDGVPQNEWRDTVRKELKTQKIIIGNSEIIVNSRSRNEYLNSVYSKYLYENYKKNIDSKYFAKLEISGQINEIILSTKNYVNEELKHVRKDNIVEFARGSVLFEIADEGYMGELVIGKTSKDELLFYDLVNIEKSNIIKRKKNMQDHNKAMVNNTAPLKRELASTDSIRNKTQKVNPNSQNNSKNSVKYDLSDVELLFDEEFYKEFEYEDKSKITSSIEDLISIQKSDEFENLSFEERYDINAKIKALNAGFDNLYDYYVGREKDRLIKDYAYEKSITRDRVEKKKKQLVKQKLLNDDISQATAHQNAQFEIIQKTNPMFNDTSVGIRSPKEIKSFAEVIEDGESFFWGDFSIDEARKALKRGTVRVYSSYPIKNGVFVSTSYVQALEYAGNERANVHSRVVALDSVAWINGDEGQYAKVYKDNIKYELSDEVDSENNQLTQNQVEFFKDSVVRDSNGNLLVVYHGTPNGDFNVFKETDEGNYFTTLKEYAEVYKDVGASQTVKKEARAPKVYKVYLNATNLFDTRKKEDRKIFKNEFFRQWGNGSPLSNKGLPDWTDGSDFKEFFEENEYDYDGVIVDEGGYQNDNGEVTSRGISYVVFNSNQIKETTNQNPTSSKDIRYDLSDDFRELTDADAPPAHAGTNADNVKSTLKNVRAFTNEMLYSSDNINELIDSTLETLDSTELTFGKTSKLSTARRKSITYKVFGAVIETGMIDQNQKLKMQVHNKAMANITAPLKRELAFVNSIHNKTEKVSHNSQP